MLSSAKLEPLLRDLPDVEAALRFFRQISTEQPQVSAKLERDRGLLADLLALAAWSPLLATTLLQNPDYFQWLSRERQQVRVKRREELGESLGRFALTHSLLDPHVLLARFRRRELLRIYLRDIRKTSTLVETTEELSNLADAILEYALTLARQDLDNNYGAPLALDEKGREVTASFCVVALGKLGSFELNYASDIDLIFIYSANGNTSAGTRGQISNKEYFIKLSELLTRIVGQQTGEGAAYRVDLRLRPHGRVGPLALSVEEIVRYYRDEAQSWELQALIRARAAAGSNQLFSMFYERVRPFIFKEDQEISTALESVRMAREEIEHQHPADSAGFNVKLGRGGIREIEFIAQALQLASGGRDDWLRVPHTLIILDRLADRRLITERERVHLFEAYNFLRTLEHRLQMELGLQTHAVPADLDRRQLTARRMGFTGENFLRDFDHAISIHTANVRRAYDRVFAGVDNQGPQSSIHFAEVEPTAETAAVRAAAKIFKNQLRIEDESIDTKAVTELLLRAAESSLNPRRSLAAISRLASSIEKSSVSLALTPIKFAELVRFCGASEYFADLLAGNPVLAGALPVEDSGDREYSKLLADAVKKEESFRAEMSALRRAWSRSLIEIGALDAAGKISTRESNNRQSRLAEASLDAALLISTRELERRFGPLTTVPRLAILALGRLGGGGIDYSSDLDLILIFDDETPSPLAHQNHAEAYARLSELLVTSLSGMTRDGFLYRVDLRLRPDGRNGPPSMGARAFLDYLSNRSVEWEWLAYVKLRAAAGDRDFAERVEKQARRIIHQMAGKAEAGALRKETRRVRARLEQEKSESRARNVIDIKYSSGGMLDVYFATRFLQLRDNIPDEGKDRSTIATLERLHRAGSLAVVDYLAMKEGYCLLRELDHQLRLMSGRATRLPPKDHPVLRDIASRVDYRTASDLLKDVLDHMLRIRTSYDRVTGED